MRTAAYNKFIFILAIIAALTAISLILPKNQSPASQNQNCPVEEKQEIVRGDSLGPIVRNGQEVKILYGYYQGNEVKRGDIVAYDYKGNPNPIIKIVKAIPGDKFGFAQSKEKNVWHILINNKILKNSENMPYLINATSYKLLSLYENGFKRVIPENTYLILGNQPSGTLDSTRFGLVDKNGLIGKVEKYDKIPQHLSSSF